MNGGGAEHRSAVRRTKIAFFEPSKKKGEA